MRSVALVLAILGLSASVALAANQPSSSNPRVACKPDVEKLCSGVRPGGHRIAACLKQNDAQVSAACKDAIAKSGQRKSQPKTQPGSSAPQGSPQSAP